MHSLLYLTALAALLVPDSATAISTNASLRTRSFSRRRVAGDGVKVVSTLEPNSEDSAGIPDPENVDESVVVTPDMGITREEAWHQVRTRHEIKAMREAQVIEAKNAAASAQVGKRTVL